MGALLGLAVWGVFALDTEAAPSQLRLYVSPSSTQVSTGTTFSLQVRLEKNTTDRVNYVYADMKFSQNLLEVVSISRVGSAFTTDNGPSIAYSNSQGTITLAGSGNDLPTPADVLVGTVVFRAKTTGTATLSFTADSKAGRQLGGTNVRNLLDTAMGATISIVTPPTAPIVSSPIPQPSIPAAPTTPVTPPPASASAPESPAASTGEAPVPAAPQEVVTNLVSARMGSFVAYGIAAGPWVFAVSIGALVLTGGVLAWCLVRFLSKRHKVVNRKVIAQQRLREMANLTRSFEVINGAAITHEPETATVKDNVSPEGLQSIENTLVGVQVSEAAAQPDSRPRRSWTLDGADDIPDMFEVGKKRLDSEGYDERLRPALNQR